VGDAPAAAPTDAGQRTRWHIELEGRIASSRNIENVRTLPSLHKYKRFNLAGSNRRLAPRAPGSSRTLANHDARCHRLSGGATKSVCSKRGNASNARAAVDGQRGGTSVYAAYDKFVRLFGATMSVR
jgi:hypothetical protein